MGVEKQSVESRLSSSCPSLAIESGVRLRPRGEGAEAEEATMVTDLMGRAVALVEVNEGPPGAGV